MLIVVFGSCEFLSLPSFLSVPLTLTYTLHTANYPHTHTNTFLSHSHKHTHTHISCTQTRTFTLHCPLSLCLSFSTLSLSLSFSTLSYSLSLSLSLSLSHFLAVSIFVLKKGDKSFLFSSFSGKKPTQEEDEEDVDGAQWSEPRQKGKLLLIRIVKKRGGN